jgi:sugar O-acyltransferase (sialic acid O-acetyltransferase NeuD family)
MNKLPLILIGGGGHCRSCIDVIDLEGKYTIEGILDAKEIPGQKIDGYPVLGNDELVEDLAEKGNHFLITIGQIKSSKVRVALFEKLKQHNAKLATIISPRTYISPNAKIGMGTIVLHGAVINAGTAIGQNSIINSLSLIEHDAIVGNHTHISTGALVNGGCSIGNNTFIGSGSIVANNITVGDKIVIGAGSLVLNDLEEPGIYAGSPVKKIKDE